MSPSNYSAGSSTVSSSSTAGLPTSGSSAGNCAGRTCLATCRDSSTAAALAVNWAKKLLVQVHVMFHLWHRIRDKTLQRRTFQRRMKPVERRILRLLRKAQLRAEPKTAGMAREILAQADCLFVFVDTEGVEPTNNTAERVIRPAVLWRKGSFGTDTADGSRFAERILTALTTLKQQRRPLLDYLERACRALADRTMPPSLLPGGHQI